MRLQIVPAFLVAAAMLSGCGLAARKEREEMLAKARADYAAPTASCRDTYPDRVKQAIVRATCLGDADRQYMRGQPSPTLTSWIK
jgi:hypothetical protein